MLYLLIDRWWLMSDEGLTFEINGIDLSPIMRTKATMQTESVVTILRPEQYHDDVVRRRLMSPWSVYVGGCIWPSRAALKGKTTYRRSNQDENLQRFALRLRQVCYLLGQRCRRSANPLPLHRQLLNAPLHVCKIRPTTYFGSLNLPSSECFAPTTYIVAQPCPFHHQSSDRKQHDAHSDLRFHLRD